MARIERATVKSRPETPAPTVPMPAITKPGGFSHLKLVLFGPPGTGKTTAAVSGTGRKLLILTEPDGDLSLLGRDDVDVVRPADGRELYAVVQALHGGLVADYDRVVLDSATFAIELVGRKSLSIAAEAGRDPRQLYGQIGNSVVQMIHDLIALPVDLVITSQIKSRSFEGDDPDAAGPEEGEFPHTLAVTPMVYKVLAPAVSVRGRTFKSSYVGADGNKKSQYLVSFNDYGKSPAGSRLEVPDVVENLDLDQLIATLKGE